MRVAILLPGSLATRNLWRRSSWSEADYRDALCAEMQREVRVPDGGGIADCQSETHIIEIDWADKFKEGVGQALTCSTKSGLHSWSDLDLPEKRAELPWSRAQRRRATFPERLQNGASC